MLLVAAIIIIKKNNTVAVKATLEKEEHYNISQIDYMVGISVDMTQYT